MTTSDSISAQNLSARYGSEVIWKDAHFAIQKGEFVGVLGPNGAGKTTLFRMLLGLIQPADGSLTVFGEKPTRGNSRIGYVPQRHQIDRENQIEALEIVRLGTCAGRWGFDTPREAAHEREEALQALRDVDAETLAHRPLGELSGGEQQRVFLAQALAGSPELLLLDEPLANLDIRRENEMVNLIERVVRARNATVLLIAHNINPLLPVLDRVMYVANKRVRAGVAGEVLSSRSLSELYDAPVEVLHDSHGRIAIVGADEGAHHHAHD